MKFENVKVGDVVYIHKNINYGWERGRWFWIPVTVTKVTKTQFTAGRYRFQKEYGRGIGAGATSCYLSTDSEAKDETEELKAYVEFLKKRKVCETYLNRNELKECWLDKVEQLYPHALKIKDILGGEL